MWPNPLVLFTEEILNGKIFLMCSDKKTISSEVFSLFLTKKIKFIR